MFRSLDKSFVYESAEPIEHDFVLDEKPLPSSAAPRHRAILVNAPMRAAQLARRAEAKEREAERSRDKKRGRARDEKPRAVSFLVSVSAVDKRALAEDAIRDLRTEIRHAMALRHAHLNALFGVNDCPQSHQLFVIEDFNDVGDFALVRELKLQWSARAMARVAKDVLLALDYLHAKGVAYEHLHPGTMLMNHRGRVRLTLTPLLSAFGPCRAPLKLNQSVLEKYQKARQQFKSKRTRDILDLAIVLFDVFALDWNSFEKELSERSEDGPLLITDFWRRLRSTEMKEDKTLSSEMLLEHPWLKPADDKANNAAMLGVVEQLKDEKRAHFKRQRAKRREAAMRAAAERANQESGEQSDNKPARLAISLSVPRLGLRHELFEFRPTQSDVAPTAHLVGRIKALVVQYYVKNVFLSASLSPDQFFFVMQRKHQRPLKLDDSAAFSVYKRFRGRNGEFRLQLLQEGVDNHIRPPPPTSPRPHRSRSRSPSGNRVPKSPRRSHTSSPRSPKPSRALSPRARATHAFTPNSPRGSRALSPEPREKRHTIIFAAPGLESSPAPGSQSERIGASGTPLIGDAELLSSDSMSERQVPLSPSRRPPAPPQIRVSGADEPLYNHWTALFDASGAKFYHNAPLGLSTWRHPAALTEAELVAMATRAQKALEERSLRDQLGALLDERRTLEFGDVLSEQQKEKTPQLTKQATLSGQRTLEQDELAAMVRDEIARPKVPLPAARVDGELRRAAVLRPRLESESESESDEDPSSNRSEHDDSHTDVVELGWLGAAQPARPNNAPLTLGRAEGDVLRDALQSALALRNRLDMAKENANIIRASKEQQAQTALLPAESQGILYSKIPSVNSLAVEAALEEHEAALRSANLVGQDYRRFEPFVVEALYDNEPEHDGELAFDRGDHMIVFAEEGGWYEGTHEASGVSGWFSKNFCRPIK